MRISDHLMERFLSGDCTEEENRQVIAFFKDNPEKLAQYLTEENWENFDPEPRYGTPSPQVRQSIENSVGRAPVRKMRIGRMAAAAVVFLVCLGSYFYWRAGARDKNHTSLSLAATTQPPVKDSVLQAITNESAQPKMIRLADGSTVKLAPGSNIAFNNASDRRDIFLKGEAVFTVMKDKVRPFTVHSKGIATTALGTVFSVNDKVSLFTTVHLYSGKVVVKKEIAEANRPFKNVYLQPGQQLILNNENFSVQIKNTERTPMIAVKEESKSSRPQLLNFTKQPLSDIFSRLQKECKTTIFYDAAIMKNMDFTGTFDRDKETLESFLSTLCDLNELTLKKTNNNGFSIQVK
jgi:ferric-dicitrate binding protein FerR (iron transport regulator)